MFDRFNILRENPYKEVNDDDDDENDNYPACAARAG